MAQYYPVYPKFWTEAKSRGWSESTRTLGIYLLTCKHRNLEGLYELPTEYVAADLGWSTSRVTKALSDLASDDFAVYDYDASVVFLVKALKFHQPKTKPQLKGALASLAKVPPTALEGRFTDMAKELHWPLFKAMTDGVEAAVDALVDAKAKAVA